MGMLREGLVLIVSSIFYKGDLRVKDHDLGIFDEEGQRRLVEMDLRSSRELHIPYALDVIISSAGAAEPYLKFASQFGVPVFIDGLSPEVRIRAYRKARELGIEDISVANAIYRDTGDEELSAIRESGIKSAVLVAFDPRDALGSMRREVKLRMLEEELIPKAERAGVEEFLVDVVVLDPASVSLAADAMSFLKERGYRVGCAPANAFSFLSRRRFGEEAHPMLTAVLAYLRMRGADFLIIGPAGRLSGVARGLALLESFLALERGLDRSRLREHPFIVLRELQRIFQEVSRG
ncbi:MAG: hypothetical protein BA066_05110 [Candidatus Korarchaeota archaeon NZ13-K]|nr:MAG: hypothetical protein BA066_05110 [Candidatus Korarchaeota archaeon NZ13-K]